MSAFAALITAAKSVKSLQGFVDSGGVADILAEIQLEAARKTLSKASLSKNKREHVLIAVGQLETALSALEYKIKSYSGIENALFSASIKFDLAERQARYVLCILAVCYKYLGEEELCRNQLEKASSPPRLEPSRPLAILGLLGGLATGLPQLLGARIYEVATGRDSKLMGNFDRWGEGGVSDEDVKALRTALLSEYGIQI